MGPGTSFHEENKLRTMENENGSEFYAQLGGSATANFLFTIAFVIYKCFSEKCQHSKCKSNLKWCQCSAQEDSIEESKEDESFQRIIKEKISEIEATIHRRVRTKRSQAVPFDGLQIRSPRNLRLVEDRKTQESI